MIRYRIHTTYTQIAAFLVVYSFLYFNHVNAQDGRGGQAGEFLRFGVGARALGMGRAFTALADDASAVYWNPAGIGLLDQTGLAFMHSELFLDTRYQFLGFLHPFSNSVKSKWNFAAGFGYIGLNAENFEEVDAFNEVTGSFSTQDYAIMFPVSLNLMNSWGNFNFGVKPQLISQDIGGVSGKAFGMDFGLVYQPLSPRKYALGLGLVKLKYLMPWRLGINYRMLGSASLGESTTDYPNSLNMGVSNVAFEDILDLLWPFGDPFASKPLKVIFAYEFEKVFNTGRTAEHRLGSEIRWRPLNSIVLAGRFGYNLARASTENKLSWGFGIRSDSDWLTQAPFIKGLEVDFSQINHPQLDNAFQVYFTLKIGDWKNNVRNVRKGQVWNANSSPVIRKSVLLQYLSEYSNDDRVVEELQGLDITYKDTVAAALSYYSDAAGDKWLVDRYDEFIGGPRKIDKKFDRLLTLNFGSLTGVRKVNAGTFEQFTSLREDYENYKSDLSKAIYAKSLERYLKLLLLDGQKEAVKNIILGRDSDIKNNKLMSDKTAHNYFRALSADSPAAYDESIAHFRKVGDTRSEIYMKFRNAVVSGDPSQLANLVSSAKQKGLVFFSNLYDPFPLIRDGILADDIMFVLAYQRALKVSDAKSVRDLFLPIVFELPHTDLGRVIAMKLKYLNTARSYDAARQVFDPIWLRYKELFLGNQPINVSSLVQPQFTVK